MNSTSRAQLLQAIAAEGLSSSQRALRMRLGRANAASADLRLQRIDLREALNNGITARLGCLSPRANLPRKSFIGQPVEVQIATDQGAALGTMSHRDRRKDCQSDGSLTVYEREAREALCVL